MRRGLQATDGYQPLSCGVPALGVTEEEADAGPLKKTYLEIIKIENWMAAIWFCARRMDFKAKIEMVILLSFVPEQSGPYSQLAHVSAFPLTLVIMSINLHYESDIRHEKLQLQTATQQAGTAHTQSSLRDTKLQHPYVPQLETSQFD